MKHRILKKFTAAVAIGGALAVAALNAAADGRPTEKSLALPGGGTGTNIASAAYSAGIGQSVYTCFRPLAYEIVFASALPDAKTVSIRRSATGPVYATFTVASNATSAVSFETNEWYVLRGQTFYVETTATNAGTLVISGAEK